MKDCGEAHGIRDFWRHDKAISRRSRFHAKAISKTVFSVNLIEVGVWITIQIPNAAPFIQYCATQPVCLNASRHLVQLRLPLPSRQVLSWISLLSDSRKSLLG